MPRKLGAKLKSLREEHGLTQEEMARAVGCSHEFISYIELGSRLPSLPTLSRLAAFLNKDVAYFLEEKETGFNLLLRGGSPEYKKLSRLARQEIRKFQQYCETYLRLEDLTGRRLEPSPLYTHVSAARMAEEERRRLGLGDEPIRDIFALLELNGCRILRKPIAEAAQLSGVFVFYEARRVAFALINSADSLGRQAFTAAHEYCHYLKDRFDGPVVDNPDVFIDEYVSLYHPRERFAQAFASHFLIPHSKVREIIEKDIASSELRFEDVLYLKRYFGVSTLAMLRTLVDLGHMPRVRLEEFRRRDTDMFEDAVFGPDAIAGAAAAGAATGATATAGAVTASPTAGARAKRAPRRRAGKPVPSDRFLSLAFEAFRRKKITAGELAACLGTKKAPLRTQNAQQEQETPGG